MTGTKAGGLKAKETTYKKHGKDFYVRIGSKGGSTPTTKPKGFAKDPKLAKIAGAIGGHNSSRAGVKNGESKSKRKTTLEKPAEKPTKKTAKHSWWVFRRSDK